MYLNQFNVGSLTFLSFVIVKKMCDGVVTLEVVVYKSITNF